VETWWGDRSIKAGNDYWGGDGSTVYSVFGDKGARMLVRYRSYTGVECASILTLLILRTLLLTGSGGGNTGHGKLGVLCFFYNNRRGRGG